jgi:hypothetical protein
VRLVGHGHPAIRATHTKTLEFSPDADITERATCVVAVGTERANAPVAGPVRITISARGQSFSLEARANSGWDASGSAVIRRGPMRLRGTLATHATAAASDLPRALVDALRDPGTQIEIDLSPAAGPPCAVLAALDPGRPAGPQLAAEIAAADLVVAEDEDTARALGERVAHGSVAVTGRVLVVAARELPGRTVLDSLRTAQVETVGLPPQLAAACASPSRGPLLIVPEGAGPRMLLRGTPAGTRLVLSTRADALPALLALAAEVRGPAGAVLVQDSAPPLRIEAGERPQLPSKSPVHVCFDAATESGALDPRVRAAIDGLLADGVATKPVANALAELAGWPRSRAYDEVVARRSRRPEG